ncbi:DFFB-like protein [Mya arenaria]|uniref:DFFB-like protein n=1 Tax=Mya arenaria TaxID=6604 RepID=A0ABY7F5R0_MYAAR|nr:DFFB-like protein [Mya arenaria]
MFSRFLSLFNRGMRAYKVQDVKRGKRVGVTAKTFQELVNKGCEKLELDPKTITIVLEDDGTLVDSNTFFQKLPAQTVLVFLKPGETWGGAGALIHDALSQLYNMSRKTEIADQIKDLLAGEGSPEKAKEQIEKESKDSEAREMLSETLEQMMNRLKKNDYHGAYFDRTAKSGDRMCDKKGWFQCEGPFDSERCESFHTINPYASRGYRQLFGLWNLDHVIEKSREILPTLLQASKERKKHEQINWEHVYKLLFTRANLKLVQI